MSLATEGALQQPRRRNTALLLSVCFGISTEPECTFTAGSWEQVLEISAWRLREEAGGSPSWAANGADSRAAEPPTSGSLGGGMWGRAVG